MRSRAGRGGFGTALLVVLAVLAPAQQVIENPAKPKAANAGRVIAPKEVLAISDEGTGDFYFSWPHGLATAPDGSLLLTDENQVLHFEANGKFLRNLFKKGQGPGEMAWPGTPFFTEKNIVVHSGSPNKLAVFDRSGSHDKDISLRYPGRSLGWRLIGHQAGRIYFETGEFPRTTGDPDIVDNPRTILEVDALAGEVKTLGSFVTRAWVVSSPSGGGGMISITRLIALPFRGTLLVLTHTEDYLIKLYDPEAGQVVRQFRRPYDRVKGEPLTEEEKKGGMIINGKHYTRPERKFENDIKNFLVRDDRIWAVTSTKDKAKGVLIDVFDGEGIYQDRFWLKLPEAALTGLQSPGQCALEGEFLWVVERTEDETYAIRKYRVGL
jgi:hypothetical protein